MQILDFYRTLTVAGHVDFLVAPSEEAPFRRKFSFIFDTLQVGRYGAASSVLASGLEQRKATEG